MELKILFKFREAVFARNGDDWMFIDGYKQVGQDPLEYDYKRVFKSINPILVWRTFISQIQFVMEKRIGQMLESEKRNKYTSIPLGKTLTPAETEYYMSGEWIEKENQSNRQARKG